MPREMREASRALILVVPGLLPNEESRKEFHVARGRDVEMPLWSFSTGGAIESP
jgi:hypothetical protein